MARHVEQPKRILTAQNLCDVRACNATAYARVFYDTGSLDFCGHHFTEGPPAMLEQSMYHLDELWAIP